jgi:phage/plasmid-associated DNA primase
VMADDDAMWRRLLRLPFTHKPKIVDRYLKAVLTSKETSIGILAWAVEGCVRWHREGLRIPRVVEDSTRALQAEMNPLSEFIGDYYEAETTSAIPLADVTFAYERWCKVIGQRFPLNKRGFNRNMETLGFHQGHRYLGGKRMRCWIGLKVKDLNRIPIDERPDDLPLDDIFFYARPSEVKPSTPPTVPPVEKPDDSGAVAEGTKASPPTIDDDDDDAYFKRLAEDD